MQYRASIPNERSLHCEKECAKVKGKWREINIYQNLASIVLIPCVIVAFWRGSWDLLDHYHQFFPPGPTLSVSALLIVMLELSRNFISKHLKILDEDTRLTVLKKNILLSFYDVIYNLSNVVLWRILWGHPEGECDLWISLLKLTETYHFGGVEAFNQEKREQSQVQLEIFSYHYCRMKNVSSQIPRYGSWKKLFGCSKWIKTARHESN